MRILFLLVILLVVNPSLRGQTISDIKTVEQAKAFAEKNPKEAWVYQLRSADANAPLITQLLALKQGESMKIGSSTYKIVETRSDTMIKILYIYLDGNRLSLSAIDSVRKSIIAQFHNGVSFEQLNARYNMDGNARGLDWWTWGSGMIDATFENAAKAQKPGEISTIDVPENNWHYVTFKPAENKISITQTVLEIAE